jgi:Ca2+/H+ antiporter, TMEM165/GDT1 family
MEALVISTLVVALGEIGDKTQLLSLLLAVRFQRPGPIILGILWATLANHLLAGFVGEWVRNAISPDVLRLVLGGSFLALAAGRSSQIIWMTTASRKATMACSS